MPDWVAKHQKILIISYIAFFILGALLVRNALSRKDIKIEGKKEEKAAIEIKPVKVTLQVEHNSYVTEYKARMKNTDTVLEFLEELRMEQGFWYEKTAYIYGTELDEINHVKAPKGYKWKVFLENEDITFEILDINLEDGKTYKIKLIPST